MSNSDDINPDKQVRKSTSVRFQGDVKLPDGTAASELAVESAQTSSAGEESSPVQQVELGLLKPERQYEVTICPVAEGTQLANIKESTGLAVGINRTEGEAGEGPHVTCQLVTPREGDVVHFFSADFVDASGAVIKHRAFSIAGKVMTSDKGTPAEKTFVRCMSKNSSGIPTLSSTASGGMPPTQ